MADGVQIGLEGLVYLAYPRILQMSSAKSESKLQPNFPDGVWKITIREMPDKVWRVRRALENYEKQIMLEKSQTLFAKSCVEISSFYCSVFMNKIFMFKMIYSFLLQIISIGKS